MTIRLKGLAIPILAAGLLTAVMAQEGAKAQPTDPLAQPQTVPPQSTPPTFPEPAPDAQTPRSSDSTSTAPAEGRIFAGSIERQKSGFVLKSGNESYKLDDQNGAKHYKGKNVKVTGSLDKATHTIHVERIEASSSM